MKKIFASSAVAVFTLLAVSAAANPPNAIQARYDASRGELYVQVEHVVSDRASHFIDKVTVSKNGTEVASESFDSQTSNRNQTLPPFKLKAASGDKLTVTAECNKWGEKSVTISVGLSQGIKDPKV
ncbi:MAG TPA: hypothetical protein PLY45_06245, partial [bacterium]|nr:hypothetical protein [bacterium]